MADQIYLSNDFLQWLADAGVIPYTTRRVVIDANMGEALVFLLEVPDGLANSVQAHQISSGNEEPD